MRNMYKINQVLLVALFSVLLTACDKNAPFVDNTDPKAVSFTATFDPATRTELVAGNQVEWISGDAISIFDADTNRRAVTSDNGASATFTVSLTEAGPWYAVYPYDSTASISGSVITTNLPAVQTAADGTFADDLNIAVALSDEGRLTFKNVLGLIKFTLTSADIKSITLMGNAEEVVAGDININYNAGAPTWTSKVANRSIFLQPDGATFAPGTYFFAVLPQTFASGVSFTFAKSDGTFKYIHSTKSLTLPRSTIVNVGNIEDKIINPDDPIVFADSDVKTALLGVAGIDANSDGEISYAEAAAVTYTKIYNIVGDKGENAADLWGDLSKINSFDELQYFTGFLRSGTEYRLPAMFRGCTNLTSVVLPPNLIRIANFAFNGCSSLTQIDFPEGLQTIYGSSFIGCTSLREVVMPNTVVSMSASAFDGCSGIEHLVLSENLTQLNNTVFRNNTSLTYVHIPDNVTSIGQNAFYGCTSLEKVDFSISPKLQTINDFAFKGCTALTSFYIPSGNVIKTIGRHAFYGNSKMKTRTRNFRSLTSLGDSAFFQTAISNITIDNAGLKTIPGGCFYQCTSLQNAYVSSAITTIGEYAFYGCNNLKGFTCVAEGNTGIEMPAGVTRIERYTFSGCRYLTTLDLPEGLSFIGDRALRQCKFTGDIELPSTLDSISARVFEGSASNQSTMSSLKVKAVTPPKIISAKISNDPEVYTYELFLNVDNPPAVIYVPSASVTAYKEATGWSAYAAKIEGF